LFLILDSDEIGDGSTEQDLWLDEQLAQAANDSGIMHIFPAWHAPPLSSGSHGNSENAYMLDRLHGLFKQAGVRFVFNGHDHDYERSYYDGIYYIVAEGGDGRPADQAPGVQPGVRLRVQLCFHGCRRRAAGSVRL
jgi:hypothetical protein